MILLPMWRRDQPFRILKNKLNEYTVQWKIGFFGNWVYRNTSDYDKLCYYNDRMEEFFGKNTYSSKDGAERHIQNMKERFKKSENSKKWTVVDSQKENE